MNFEYIMTVLLIAVVLIWIAAALFVSAKGVFRTWKIMRKINRSEELTDDEIQFLSECK